MNWSGEGTAIIQVSLHIRVHITCIILLYCFLSKYFDIIVVLISQSTLTYYGCNCCNDTRAFSLELATETTDSTIGAQLDLNMRLRYATLFLIVNNTQVLQYQISKYAHFISDISLVVRPTWLLWMWRSHLDTSTQAGSLQMM